MSFVDSNCDLYSTSVTAVLYAIPCHIGLHYNSPDIKVLGANMGPTWVLSAPGGPHVGPMNLTVRVLSTVLLLYSNIFWLSCCRNFQYELKYPHNDGMPTFASYSYDMVVLCVVACQWYEYSMKYTAASVTKSGKLRWQSRTTKCRAYGLGHGDATVLFPHFVINS